jgi:hypothetical protein
MCRADPATLRGTQTDPFMRWACWRLVGTGRRRSTPEMGPLSGRRSASVSRRQARETTQMGQTGHAMQAECRADPDLQRSLSGTVAVRRLVIPPHAAGLTSTELELQGASRLGPPGKRL